MPLLVHLRRARDHIDRHYAEPLALDGLAAVAGMSKFHFARCFEATYGESPIRYLTRRRIERAQDLLRCANLTVTEVCLLVGYTSLGSFSSRFSRMVGESPVAYRNRWARQGIPHVPGCYLFMRGPRDPAGTVPAALTATASPPPSPTPTATPSPTPSPPPSPTPSPTPSPSRFGNPEEAGAVRARLGSNA